MINLVTLFWTHGYLMDGSAVVDRFPKLQTLLDLFDKFDFFENTWSLIDKHYSVDTVLWSDCMSFVVTQDMSKYIEYWRQLCWRTADFQGRSQGWESWATWLQGSKLENEEWKHKKSSSTLLVLFLSEQKHRREYWRQYPTLKQKGKQNNDNFKLEAKNAKRRRRWKHRQSTIKEEANSQTCAKNLKEDERGCWRERLNQEKGCWRREGGKRGEKGKEGREHIFVLWDRSSKELSCDHHGKKGLKERRRGSSKARREEEGLQKLALYSNLLSDSSDVTSSFCFSHQADSSTLLQTSLPSSPYSSSLLFMFIHFAYILIGISHEARRDPLCPPQLSMYIYRVAPLTMNIFKNE